MKLFHSIRSTVLRLLNVPDPNWQVTVQRPHWFDGRLVAPGYVQIDDVTGNENRWSKGANLLRLEGYNVPDFSELPSGRYSWSEAVKRLKGMYER